MYGLGVQDLFCRSSGFEVRGHRFFMVEEFRVWGCSWFIVQEFGVYCRGVHGSGSYVVDCLQVQGLLFRSSGFGVICCLLLDSSGLIVLEFRVEGSELYILRSFWSGVWGYMLFGVMCCPKTGAVMWFKISYCSEVRGYMLHGLLSSSSEFGVRGYTAGGGGW